MDRRNFFTTTMVGTGAALLATSSVAARASKKKARAIPGSKIQTRDDVELSYRDWGSGKPVVFLSGWTLPSESWSYVMLPLAKQVRCIALDRRGHGRSSDPGRGYDYDNFADDLADVLDALDLRDVTLVAHSMAGGEAVRYLSRHGSKRVARLALIATTLPFIMKTDDHPEGVDAAVFDKVRQNFLTRDLPKWLYDNTGPFVTTETSPEMLDWVRRMMLQCSMKATLDCNEAFVATDFRQELKQLSLPTLMIHGDKDASAPLSFTSARVQKLAPQAQMKVYAGGPHGLMFTHAQALAADLQSFAAA